jgi:hypothetical protein
VAEAQTWYVVVDGVLDNQVSYLGADEHAALAVWRGSRRYRPGAVRAVPRDGRFSMVSARTHRASALSDTGLSLTEAVVCYRQRQAETTTGEVVRRLCSGAASR